MKFIKLIKNKFLLFFLASFLCLSSFLNCGNFALANDVNNYENNTSSNQDIGDIEDEGEIKDIIFHYDNGSRRKKRDLIPNKVGGTITPGTKGFMVTLTNFGIDRLDKVHLELKLYDVKGNFLDSHDINDTKVSTGTSTYYWMKGKSNTVQETIKLSGYAKDGNTVYKILPTSTVRWNFVGGAYGKMEAYGGERHHCPAKNVLPFNVSTYRGPAIRMLKQDHRKTKSCGSSKEAKAYREKQSKLVKEGKYLEAMQMDIDDIKSKFGSKYNKAINQMVDYAEDELGW